MGEVLSVGRFLGSVASRLLLVIGSVERLEDWEQRHLAERHVDAPMDMTQRVKGFEFHC